MYSINENDENHQFNIEHVITVMIVIIFCLVFIIFLTILDFYKKPSIYELELLNEFKSSNCSQKNNPCEEEKKKEEEECKKKKHNKRFLLIYQDILYSLLYIIILYIISLTYLPEPIIGFIAIFLIFIFLKIKRCSKI